MVRSMSSDMGISSRCLVESLWLPNHQKPSAFLDLAQRQTEHSEDACMHPSYQHRILLSFLSIAVLEGCANEILKWDHNSAGRVRHFVDLV